MLILKEYNVSPEWLDNGTGEMFIQYEPDDEIMQHLGILSRMSLDDPRRDIIKLLATFPKEELEPTVRALEAFIKTYIEGKKNC